MIDVPFLVWETKRSTCLISATIGTSVTTPFVHYTSIQVTISYSLCNSIRVCGHTTNVSDAYKAGYFFQISLMHVIGFLQLDLFLNAS